MLTSLISLSSPCCFFSTSGDIKQIQPALPEQPRAGRATESDPLAAEVGQAAVGKFIDPVIIMESNYGTCYYKSTSVPRSCDCPPIAAFQLPTPATMTSCCGRARGV